MLSFCFQVFLENALSHLSFQYIQILCEFREKRQFMDSFGQAVGIKFLPLTSVMQN